MHNSLDKSPDNEPLGGEDLRDALRYFGYLKALGSLADVERELLTQSPRQLRAMIVVYLSGIKQRQLPPDEYGPWSRIEPLEDV